jgi:hypothetical protein
MKMADQDIISSEIIMNQIYVLRGQKVMLDRDLAKLYGVETKVLKQAVRRRIERFPDDFMFELTKEEVNSLSHTSTDLIGESLRSQFVTLKRGKHFKYLPSVFTEQGVAMLSSVLNSDRAIKVNIQIIRIFTRLRQAFHDNMELRLEIERIKQKLHHQNQNIELVFKYLDELIEKKENPVVRPKIGFNTAN